jgi:uncharacterized membrane protein
MTPAQALIYTHAALGGLALLGGLVALSVTKGNRMHKLGGRIFFYSMLFSAILALIISILPGHESSFLFAIGVFSIYLIVGGFRAWKIASKKTSLLPDTILAIAMVLMGLSMLILPAILSTRGFNPVLGVFGAIGLLLAVQDLYLFRNLDKLRKGVMRMHIGKMVGGYISAVTAFVVVNHLLPGIWGWLSPTAIGFVYIAWHFKKLRN